MTSPGSAETITGFLAGSWIKCSPCAWLPVTHVFFPCRSRCVSGSPPAPCDACPCQPGCPPSHTPTPRPLPRRPLPLSDHRLLQERAPSLLESSHLRPHHACVPSPVCSESLHAVLHYFHVKSFRARGMGFRAHPAAGFPCHPPGEGWGSAWLSDMPRSHRIRSHIFKSTAHFTIPHWLADSYRCHVKHRKISVVLHDT